MPLSNSDTVPPTRNEASILHSRHRFRKGASSWLAYTGHKVLELLSDVFAAAAFEDFMVPIRRHFVPLPLLRFCIFVARML
ncbi:hypothetical protein L596_013663 [Steinernema carpocapsae]|uniref:Uncharacterized protein n=1 Tax=Steinernema carpocapsae TaxID=34508 RepID=A0A4U5P1R3_STECR|nr:hypothetical protein L596_013663 [Steinernema carpocapsae]